MSDLVSEKEAFNIWPRAGRTIKAQREEIEHLTSRLAEIQQQGEVVVTWTPNRQHIAAVTRQDNEGRILSVIAEAPDTQNKEEK